MYDIDWARSVYATHEKLHPRGQQILLCVCQELKIKQGLDATPTEIKRIIISSIQGRAARGIWPRYKTVVRRSPLDRIALDKLVKSIVFDRTDESNQLLFEFVR